MGKRIKNPSTWSRRRLYEVAAAAVGVAGVYGLVEGREADAWLLLIAATLGLARAKTPADGQNGVASSETNAPEV